MMKKLIILLGIPALIIHELSHLIMIVLVGAKSQGVEIKGNFKGFEVIVNYNTESNWKRKIISMAPIGGFILWSIFIFSTFGLLFLGLALYTLLFIRVFFPSKGDIETYNSPIIDEIEIPEFIK